MSSSAEDNEKDDVRECEAGLRFEDPFLPLLECLTSELRFLFDRDLVVLEDHRDSHDALQFRKPATEARADATAERQERVAGPVAEETRRVEAVRLSPVLCCQTNGYSATCP